MKTISARSLLLGTMAFSILGGATVSSAFCQQTASALPAGSGSGPGEQNAREARKAESTPNGSGALLAMISGSGRADRKLLGECPLKHTSVSASVSGYISRVTVTQTFENTFKDKIEAVYTFPLSDSGAVDAMTMKIGTRVIKGSIKKREEARQIYNQARSTGHVASLLDQERTNIFTQSVANIEPGAKVEITISYSELLPYEAGKYTFVFPTVVGPRFNPGTPHGHSGKGRAFDTDKVPDASRITPQLADEGTRAGHDISIAVGIHGGMPIANLSSKLHDVDIASEGAANAIVTLKNKSTIPNKDFVLTWDVAGEDLKSGYLTHRESKDKPGYFSLMIMPPKRVTPDKVSPKEMIFVIDCSGSQFGAPLDKAKETMKYILDHMNANDSFQVIAFNNSVRTLFSKPEVASSGMKERARRFIDALTADGGTWMAPAVESACQTAADGNRLRIVTFMTDGYVGNDLEIMGLVKKLRGTSRWFPFGTGNSVNRLLINGIAKEGGGEPEFVLLNSSGEEVGRKFYSRISSPVLTNVKVDYDGLAVKEVYPHNISDVWAEKPLYIKGRYLKPGAGTVTISGFAGGKPYSQKLSVNLPEENKANAVIAPIWARAKVDRLMSEDWFGAQAGNPNEELRDEIVQTALDHHIMTQYTSFVAVDESRVTKGGADKTVPVKVEVPDGVSREHATGEPGKTDFLNAPHQMQIIDERPMLTASSRFGLPKTSLDSFVFEAGGDAAQIYGDEGSYNVPPYFEFSAPHRIETGIHGVRRGGLTTLHGSLMPDALGGDEWVDGPEFTFSGPKAASPAPASGGAFSEFILDWAAGKAKTRIAPARGKQPAPSSEAATQVARTVNATANLTASTDDARSSTGANARLDAYLVRLIAGKSALPSTIKLDNGRVLIKVTLLKINERTLSLLRACGLKVTKTDANEVSVCGWILPAGLRHLAQQDCVKFIAALNAR